MQQWLHGPTSSQSSYGHVSNCCVHFLYLHFFTLDGFLLTFFLQLPTVAYFQSPKRYCVSNYDFGLLPLFLVHQASTSFPLKQSPVLVMCYTNKLIRHRSVAFILSKRTAVVGVIQNECYQDLETISHFP